MKNIVLIAAFALTLFSACREPETKTVVKEVEVQSPKDEKGMLERTAERVDKKVNDRVDEEIDKIGDDN